MYFFTPRGLKIRLNEEYCFNQNFKSETNIFDMLIQVELYALLRDYFAFVFGVVLFLSKEEPWTIFIFTFYITLIGIFIPLFYPLLINYHFISFLFFKRIHAILSACYIDKVIIIVLGIIFTNWKSVFVYFIGFYLAVLLGFIINTIWARNIFKKHGVVIGDVERIFINISRVYFSEKTTFPIWLKNYKKFMKVSV